MITIYKYHLDRDHVHVRSRNAHVLEFLSVQIQHDEITLWALVDTEKPANYADIYVLGTGWNLGEKREPWLTKANFVDTVQDPDGLVWHIFGVLPEDKQEDKANDRDQVRTQKAEDKSKNKELQKQLNDAKEYIEKQYAKEFVKGYIKLLGELFDEDLTKEFEDLDATISETIERAYRDFKENGESISKQHACDCGACKSDAGICSPVSRGDEGNTDGNRNTYDNATTKDPTVNFNESEACKILRKFINNFEREN